MADLDTPVRGGGAIGGMLTRKYGGIPAFVILLVVAGGAYLYIRHKGSSGGGYASAVTGNGTDSGMTDLGSESGYQASGQPQIVFIPASGDSATNPQSSKHPAGPGGKKQAPKGWTGRGARGFGHGYHGNPPKKYPVRH